jgi:hypothetical protein
VEHTVILASDLPEGVSVVQSRKEHSLCAFALKYVCLCLAAHKTKQLGVLDVHVSAVLECRQD